MEGCCQGCVLSPPIGEIVRRCSSTFSIMQDQCTWPRLQAVFSKMDQSSQLNEIFKETGL